MALLVLAMIPAGFVMVQPDLDRSLQNALFVFHKNTGVLLLVLVVSGPLPLAASAGPASRRPAGLAAQAAGLSHLRSMRF
jgi:cytochrome b561